MVRCGAILLVLLGLAASAHAAEPEAGPPVPPASIDEAARKARFTAFVIEGDRARASGRLTAAAKAYSAALELRRDPLVAGRLGVVIVELGQPADAGDLLLEAIQEATNASPEERHGFLKAYDMARAQVTWLDVTISEANATVTLDGEPKNRAGFSAFSMFVTPGEHEVRARLDGYEDAVEIFTARKGQKQSVTLTLKAKAQPIPPPLRLRREPTRVRIAGLDDPPKDEPNEREPIVGGVVGEQKKPKPRFSVGAGPVVVLGVASWMPALGINLGVGVRANDYVWLGLEGRAAWLTSDLHGEPIRAMTAGGIASGCGHLSVLFGCALAHVGVLNIQASERSYQAASFVNVKPGAGLRLGADLAITRAFKITAAVDALVLTSGVTILVNDVLIADQPPVMLGAQINGAWEL